MLEIEFEDYKNIDGYSMGHITLFDGKITSKDKIPTQTMMIFPSLIDLLNGLSKLVETKREYDFIGIDSSFFVKFKKKNNYILVFYKNKEIISFEEKYFLESIYREIFEFSKKYKLKKDDITFNDLHRALKNIKNGSIK